MDEIRMRPVARVRSDFPEKFGIPRQSGLVEQLRSTLVFEPEFRDENALRGIEQFSHLWLIWQFSANAGAGWSPTVRPPRLGGNLRLGVFATRSPFRPNPIGLSCVRLEGVRRDARLGMVLEISGADLMDGTPVLDIKPYIPVADAHPEASQGFTRHTRAHALRVEIPEELRARVPKDRREALEGVLAQDPRPAYQDDPVRAYALSFAGLRVCFCVDGDLLRVTEIAPL